MELQILFLTLIPVLSGIVPQDGMSAVAPTALFGVAEPVTAEFIQGTWKTADEFFRWGITDREKATTRAFPKTGFVKFSDDGTVRMVNLFQPTDGQWEIGQQGLVIRDPRYPEAPVRVIPIRKRDENRIWMLIPFSGGAIGIGLERTDLEDIPFEQVQQNTKKNVQSQRVPISRAKSDHDTSTSDDIKPSTETFFVPQWEELRNEPVP